MSLLIVIVNYKSAELVLDCLRSLEDDVRSIGDCRVSLTDCLSPDDSVARLRNGIDALGFAGWVDLRPLPRNGGFAYGNNEGIRPYLSAFGADAATSPGVDPRYVLLLNPDTYIRPGAVRRLFEHLEQHPQAGIAGSRLEFPDGSPHRSAFRFPTISSEFEGGLRLGLVSRLLSQRLVAPPVSDHAMQTDWVCGASMMVRREVFERIGLLDDGFFMYYEEVDFCLRAHQAGWSCDYVPSSRVVHLCGQSSGIVTAADASRRRRPPYWFQSRRRYFVKNHGVLYAAVADLVHATGYALWRIRRALTGKPDLDPDRFLGDFLRHSVLLRGPRDEGVAAKS